MVSLNEVHLNCHLSNSLAKPHLEALDSMIDEEEGELEEQEQEEQERGEGGQGELPVDDVDNDEDLHRKFIEDEFSDDSEI